MDSMRNYVYPAIFELVMYFIYLFFTWVYGIVVYFGDNVNSVTYINNKMSALTG